MIVMIDGVRYSPVLDSSTIGSGEPFAVVLQRMRKLARLSLDKAAADIGCSKSYLWTMEKGESEPTLAMAKKIAIAYGVSVDFLAVHIESAPGGDE